MRGNLVPLVFRLGLMVPRHALQLLLTGKRKKTVYFVYHDFKPLFFDYGKEGAEKKVQRSEVVHSL